MQLNDALVNVHNAALQQVTFKELEERMIDAHILRLDLIHPVISGNKWFKLKYYLEDAVRNGYKIILSFGGAWSNHIIATACAARHAGLGSIGVIRGERPATLSQTLEAALTHGMQLDFVNRLSYSKKDNQDFIENLKKTVGEVYIIPEGGAGEPGIRGSKEILQLAGQTQYTHIVCCIGTGTMFAGLARSSSLTQRIIGIPVLKGLEAEQRKIYASVELPEKIQYCEILYDYHFGGYARKTPHLLNFMNHFYQATGVPTDFVYTGKLLYAFTDLLKKDYFPPGSNILIIHSGGLQGNASLPVKSLVF